MIGIYKLIKDFLLRIGFGRVALFRRINDFLHNHLVSKSVIVMGHKMYLDKHDLMSLSIDGPYEKASVDLIRSTLKKGCVCLDIGANIGYWSLVLARVVSKTGKVFSFEPDSDNFKLLTKNIEVNGYKNVVLTQKAVYSKTTVIDFYIKADFGVDQRVYDPGDGRKSVKIEAVSIDDFCVKNGIEKVDFIKMDIQGAEAMALKGMRKLVKKSRNLAMLVEFWPTSLKNCGSSGEDFLKLLDNMGFKVQIMDGGDNPFVDLNDYVALTRKYPKIVDEYVDLYCTKKA